VPTTKKCNGHYILVGAAVRSVLLCAWQTCHFVRSDFALPIVASETKPGRCVPISDSVRSFGKQLEQDHSAANAKAMNVAKEMGMTPPTEPSKKQKADYDRMSQLSGDKFDSMFVKHMISGHKKNIKAFQKEAKTNDRPAGFANDVLPDLQTHLDTAQSLQGKSGTTGSR
jgi:hypothetical protein